MSGTLATPEATSAQARRNHRWMVLLAMTPIVFIILYIISAYSPHEGDPVVEPVRVPAGWIGVTDAYYGYATPSGWKENSAFSDANGDFYYNGPGGWAGEHLSVQKTSPTPSSPIPEALKAFDTAVPTGFTETDGHAVHVQGAAFAWAVTLTRPGGFRAGAVDVWERQSQEELWLMVRSSPATTTTVLTSLRASATN
jgi:hypothetical protein